VRCLAGALSGTCAAPRCSAHSTENDNPDALLEVVRDFIRRVEARQ
jgi:hypothetical protein